MTTSGGGEEEEEEEKNEEEEKTQSGQRKRWDKEVTRRSFDGTSEVGLPVAELLCPL